MRRLEKVASWNVDENCRKNPAEQERHKHTLDKDSILNLSQRRLLNPDLTIKDLAHDIPLLILNNPRLVLVRLARPSRIQARLLALGFRVLEELPWAQVTVVHAVENDTHALIRSDEGSDSDNPEKSGNGSDATWSCRKREEDGPEEPSDDEEDSETASEDDASAVTVADGPADEVWVGLAAERGLNCLVDVAEGGWVGGVLQSLQEDDALAGGEVELAGGILNDVSANDTVHLLAERLNGD